MLGDRERLIERKRAEQVDLEPEYGPFAGPARGILYHREASLVLRSIYRRTIYRR